MTDPTYEGWKNRSTWNVKLWLDNEEPSYRYFKALTETLIRQEDEDIAKDCDNYIPARIVLANMIEEYVDEHAPDLGVTMYGDMLQWAIAQTDYREIAEAYLRDVREDAEYQKAG